MAHCICYCLDGQYGGAVLDLQSREIMEGVCERPCEKDRRNHSRDRNNPTDKNLADLGSRGASLDKMKRETGSQDQTGYLTRESQHNRSL